MYNAHTPLPRSSITKGSKVLANPWAMKKFNGTFWGRLNAREYEKVDGSHFLSDSIAAQWPTPSPYILSSHYCEWIPLGLQSLNCWRSFSLVQIWEWWEPVYWSSWWIGRMVSRQCGSENECTFVRNQASSILFFFKHSRSASHVTYVQSKANSCMYFACNGDNQVVLVASVNAVMILGPPAVLNRHNMSLRVHSLAYAMGCSQNMSEASWLCIEMTLA